MAKIRISEFSTKNIFCPKVNIVRFDNLPSLYFGPKKFTIKKNRQILWKSMESCSLYRVSKKIIVQHPLHLWPFLKTLTGKLMPHFQISFKSWLNHTCLDFFCNQCFGDFNKLVFRLLELLLNLEQS